MWGWRTVKRTIAPAVFLEEAILIAKENGFSEASRDGGWAELQRSGTIFTFSGPKMPLCLRIEERDDERRIAMKYDSLNRSRSKLQRGPVLFDTGDLRKFTEALSASLRRESS